MFNGVSAIEAHQQQMDVIGNNIANVNTTGYKAGRVTFQDQLSQTLQGASAAAGNVGGINPVQIGLGVQVASIDQMMTQGGLEATSRPTDMAIQGNGFFTLSDTSGLAYTRDGSFNVDSNGDLVSPTGAYVLGWSADANGKIDTTAEIGTKSHLAIPIGGLSSTSPTSQVTYAGNLTADPTQPGSYNRSVKVYDSLGAAHTITLTFTKSTTATNTWNWAASVPAATPPDTATVTGSGTLTFDGSGNLPAATTGSLSLLPGDGSKTPQTIALNFGRVTQNSNTSDAAPALQDGAPPGTLQSFSMDETGLITGIFSNGATRPLGQIAVTSFANPEGLSHAGSSSFRQSSNSGLPHVGTPLAGGLGKISTGYLEQSNVDLSTEFTNMIITQRGYQANTKIVSTVDQMLDDIIRIRG